MAPKGPPIRGRVHFSTGSKQSGLKLFERFGKAATTAPKKR